MNDFRLSFTLKQHTPMIHFQHDQPGATLRATELKPKLDKFLRKYFDEKEIDYRPWLIKDQEAFDYKVSITSQGGWMEPIEYQGISRGEPAIDRNGNPTMSTLPMFFANKGEEWTRNPKKLVKADTVIVEFFSFKTKLLSYLLELFEHFIFTANFGMRQTKGFGSFEVIECSDKRFQKCENPMDYEEVFCHFNINLEDKELNGIRPPNVVNSSKNFKYYGKLFEVLNLFSKTYRSGINQQGYYFKSMMYRFAKEEMNGATWDKKYFKASFLGNENEKIKEQRKKHKNPEILDFSNIDPNNTFLLRDLLGLASHQEWQSYNPPRRKAAIDISHNSIKRYASPIVFKILETKRNHFRVYLVVRDVANKMLGKTFNVTPTNLPNNEPVEISTPATFDLRKYLNYCIESFQEENDHNISKALTYIYSQLKKSNHRKVFQ